MISNVLNNKANKSNRGAEYYRCALQVNPHDYLENFRGAKEGIDASTYAKSMVDKAEELDIAVLAITDHNDVGSVPMFQQAAEGRNVTIFPGFELASSEGIHVLCIYPPETSGTELERFLGGFGIKEVEPSSALANKTFSKMIETVQYDGGLTIAAHVSNNKGLFKKLSGESRVNAWRDPNLLAIQIPGSVEGLPENIRTIVKNQNPQYRREHMAGEKLAIAVVNASDVCRSDALEGDSATCWIKMSEIGIEGLRQAFLDPESRIRLKSDPLPDKHAELVSIEWKGGFLDGLSVDFNSNLNVLIGGRGAGKSTVIESIRYVLGLDPIGDDIRKIHEGFIKQVLKNGTKISLVLNSYSPEKRKYIVERTVPNPPIVYNDYRQELRVLPSEVFPNVELYGQHEISNLSKIPEERKRLLDRFIQKDLSISQRKAELEDDLKQTRQSLLDVQSQIRKTDEELETLPGLEERLKGYREAGVAELLEEQSQLVREEQLFASMSIQLKTFLEYLQLMEQEVPIDVTFLSERVLEGLLNRDIFEEGVKTLNSLSSNLEAIIKRLADILETTEKDVEVLYSNWKKRKRAVQIRYEKLSRDLQKQSIDSQEFIDLKKRTERLYRLRDWKQNLWQKECEQRRTRRSLLVEWQELKENELSQLKGSAKKVNNKLRDVVQVTVDGEGERKKLYDLLTDKIGGRLHETIEALSKVESLALLEFVACCREGVASLINEYRIPENQAQRLANASEDCLLQIEELELPPRVQLELNTNVSTDQPSWQKFDNLSTGQKATVALLILLLESGAPLIVDQPEDDLDNRFITENVIPRVRKEKARRQFIFATHNANIPVLGDAELILGLTSSGEAGDSNTGQATIDSKHVGSIDFSFVRQLVEEILEGGEAAFELRRRKYGF